MKRLTPTFTTARAHAPVKFALLALTAALALAGCTKTIKPEARNPTKLVAVQVPQASLQTVFSYELKGAKLKRDDSLHKKDVLDLQLAVDGERMVAASKDGVVQGFEGGHAIWTVNVGEAITSGVGYDAASQTAIVSTRQGTVIALDAVTGTVAWKQSIGATVLSPALVAGNRVLLSANDGVLHGLNLQSGASVWQFSTNLPNVSVRGAAKPLRLDGASVLFATADGRIYALAIDSGNALWTRRVGVAIGGSDVGRMSDADGTPLVVDNRLYVTSYSGHLVAFDMSTGRTLFTLRDFASLRVLAHLNGVIVGVDTDGVVQGFNAHTGERLWQNDALKFRKPSHPVTIGQFVALGDYDGVVHLFDQSGALVGRAQAKGKGAIVSLQAIGNRLYAQTSAGQVVVWQVQ